MLNAHLCRSLPVSVISKEVKQKNGIDCLDHSLTLVGQQGSSHSKYILTVKVEEKAYYFFLTL